MNCFGHTQTKWDALLVEQKDSIKKSSGLQPQSKAFSNTIDTYRVYIQLNYELEVISQVQNSV
jgi:hypothetical protein